MLIYIHSLIWELLTCPAWSGRLSPEIAAVCFASPSLIRKCLPSTQRPLSTFILGINALCLPPPPLSGMSPPWLQCIAIVLLLHFWITNYYFLVLLLQEGLESLLITLEASNGSNVYCILSFPTNRGCVLGLYSRFYHRQLDTNIG